MFGPEVWLGRADGFSARMHLREWKKRDLTFAEGFGPNTWFMPGWLGSVSIPIQHSLTHEARWPFTRFFIGMRSRLE